MSEASQEIGANNAPPFEVLTENVETLYEQAQHWLDGAAVGEPEAEKIGTLVRLLEGVGRQAEQMRVAEKKPHDDAAKAVQARFKPLADKVDRALAAARKALAPFLAAKQEAQRAEAERLRIQAEQAAAEAQALLRATNASDTQNLADREAAESAADHAKEAARLAKKAAAAKSSISNTGGRAIGVKTVYRAAVVDPGAFAKYLWLNERGEYDGFLAAQAQRYVNLGRRDGLPGVLITEEKVAV